MSDKTQVNERRGKIAALLGAGWSQKKIAEKLSVSSKTVQRLAVTLKPALDDVEAQLTQYRRELQRLLPPKRRAEILAEIAKSGDVPSARIQALRRCDEVDGLERLIDPRQERGAPDSRPLFNLPEGTRIAIMVDKPEPPQKSALPEAKSIDIEVQKAPLPEPIDICNEAQQSAVKLKG